MEVVAGTFLTRSWHVELLGPGHGTAGTNRGVEALDLNADCRMRGLTRNGTNGSTRLADIRPGGGRTLTGYANRLSCECRNRSSRGWISANTSSAALRSPSRSARAPFPNVDRSKNRDGDGT